MRWRSGVSPAVGAAGSPAASAAARRGGGESRNPQAESSTAELPAMRDVLTAGSGDFASESLQPGYSLLRA